MQIPCVSIGVHMGIFIGKNNKVILLCRGFGLHLQIRASPQNKFYLCGVHLNPHAKCRSSRFNLKLFQKRKTGVT